MSDITRQAENALQCLVGPLAQAAATRQQPERERADMWQRGVGAHHVQTKREQREAWATFHLEQAERILQTAEELAAKHRSKAEMLLGEGVRS